MRYFPLLKVFFEKIMVTGRGIKKLISFGNLGVSTQQVCKSKNENMLALLSELSCDKNLLEDLLLRKLFAMA